MTRFSMQTVAAAQPKILIVEDERAVARDLQECLEWLNYQVTGIAGTSTEALHLIEIHQPNLVLMDIVLEDSEQDGISTAQLIRDRYGLPVVFLTAHATPLVVEQVKATAPYGYLLKPFRERDLWVAIETALKRHDLEQQLHEREAWLSQILMSMGDGVIVFDVAGRVKFLNPAAISLTGWSQVEALDCSLQQVFPIMNQETRSPLVPELLQTIEAAQQCHFTFNTLLLTKAGDSMPIVDSAAPLLDQQGHLTGGVIVFRDARLLQVENERNLAVERSLQLETQLNEIERLNRLKEDFLSTVSHELRTPITNIKLATQMLTLVLDQLNVAATLPRDRRAAIAKYMGILREATHQELQLINNLLDIQQIQANAFPLDLGIVDLETWIPKVLEPFYLRADTNQQSLRLVLAPDLPLFWTDPHTLTRILSELLNNACKYTPPGERIVVTIQSSPPTTATLPWLVLEICNSGVTIPIAEQAHIFDEFYRIPQSDRWSKGGTGLGLALVKKFVTLLGGDIDVTSSQNQVCFQVRLPIREPC